MPSPFPDTPFAADFRALLEKHSITAPRFAHGAKAFDPAKPQCLYSGPVYGVDELVAATAALVEGRWSVAGEYVNRFEREFSTYLGQAESVMVNSGSSADLLMVAAAKARFGWQDGDGIIVSTVGFPTTISAITLNGLTPVFVDIEWATLNADNDAIEAALGRHNGRPGQEGLSWTDRDLTCAPPVRAIFVSPVLGNPPDMDRITELATRFGVKVLFDGCDSLGSTWRGKHLAQYATASSCSFFPAHHISTLQGGMISSDDRELVAIARSMGSWGKACWCTGAGNLLPNGCCGKRFSPWLPEQPDLILDHRYVFTTDRAYNTQPLDIQGALGLAQMQRMEAIHKARRAVHVYLSGLMVLLPEVKTAVALPNAAPSWFGFSFICPDYAYLNALRVHLEVGGVQTRGMFSGNLLHQPGYAHLGHADDYRNACQVLRRVLFVGTNPMWTVDHLSHIETTIRSFKRPSGGEDTNPQPVGV